MTAMVRNSDDAIIGKTRDGIITSWNPAAERIYGYSSDEMVGKPMDALIPQDRASEMKAILATVRAGQAVDHLETIRIRKDGEAGHRHPPREAHREIFSDYFTDPEKANAIYHLVFAKGMALVAWQTPRAASRGRGPR